MYHHFEPRKKCRKNLKEQNVLLYIRWLKKAQNRKFELFQLFYLVFHVIYTNVLCKFIQVKKHVEWNKDSFIDCEIYFKQSFIEVGLEKKECKLATKCREVVVVRRQ